MPPVQQFSEFVQHHPWLFLALGVAMALLVLNEVLARLRGARRLAPVDAVRLINHEDAVVIDVRSAADFKKGHIINARNIPANNLAAHSGELEKFRAHPVLCYCELGNRSPQVCDALTKQGFERCYVLKGGMNAWRAAELPTTKR